MRTVRHTLACVARRLALPALVLYDLRQTMLELEGDVVTRLPAGRAAGRREAAR